ncbi:MAG TPA: hypothetical protein VKB25_01125 [Conexibacter sp.]|nr:hypothetical protein [Conexibacter sp.]
MKLTIFLSAIALLALPAVGSAAATTVSTSGLAGWSASGFVGHGEDPDDSCHGHSASVEAFDRRKRDDEAGPSKDLWLRLALTESDLCSGPGSYDPPIPTDFTIYGEALLAPGDLTVRGDLGTAALKGTIAFRPYGWTSTWPIDIDLTWHAVDDADRHTIRFMYGFPDEGRRVVYRYMGNTRRAVVSGTVTASPFFWGRTVEYGGNGYGSLFSGHTGDVVIQK